MEIIGPPVSLETVASWGNNDPPVLDAVIARPWISMAETELARIDNEIHSLESRRVTLHHQLAVYRVAFSTHYHKILPVDILRQVFILAAWTDCGGLEVDLNSATHPGHRLDIRFILCQICCHWRSVALETHELWSNIRVIFQRANATRLLEAFDMWLSRSGEYPLTLSIRGQVDGIRIGQVLAKYAHRCRTLSVANFHSMHPFPDLPPRSMNRLETLILGDEYCTPSLIRPLTVFIGATSLRSVTLLGLDRTTNLQDLGIPWHQLTELFIDHTAFPSSRYYAILSQCSALTSGKFCLLPRQSDDILDVTEWNFPLPLVSLSLGAYVLDDAARFLQGLCLASLLDLTLNISFDLPVLSTPVPLFPALWRLSIFGSNWRPQFNADIMPWLNACNSAVEVFLPHCILGPACSQIADGSLLPKLELLTVRAPEVSIIAMLEARLASRSHSTITEVGFVGYGPRIWGVDSELRESLEALMMAKIFVSGVMKERPHRGEIQKSASWSRDYNDSSNAV